MYYENKEFLINQNVNKTHNPNIHKSKLQIRAILSLSKQKSDRCIIPLEWRIWGGGVPSRDPCKQIFLWKIGKI